MRRFKDHGGRKHERIDFRRPAFLVLRPDGTDFALLFYEFGTNAAKHGALSKSDGRIHIDCSDDGDTMSLIREYGVGDVKVKALDSGFGSVLISATVEHSLGGQFEQTSKDDCLELRITFPRKKKAAPA